ncbi:MAG: hypothetical protein HKN44_15210 [Ilumatobacter sp.]|nr:hypothetical protein [Ilumatobacter sp.]
MTDAPTRRDGPAGGGRRWFGSPRANRRAGRVMVAVAVVGLVVSAAGTLVAWRLVGEINSSTRDTLGVTIETIDSVENSIDLADQVLAASSDTIATGASTLAAVAESFDAANGVVEEVDDLTTTVGPALADAAATLRQLEGVGATIDDLLGGLSAIPFGPDYRPERGLGETIGELASDIDQLPAEFLQTSEDLRDFGTSLDDLEEEIVRLSGDIAGVSARLEASDAIIDGYRRNVSDARAVAVSTRDDLDGDVTLMRLLLVIGGINLAVAQIVPYWIGRTLLATAAEDR